MRLSEWEIILNCVVCTAQFEEKNGSEISFCCNSVASEVPSAMSSVFVMCTAGHSIFYSLQHR